MQLCILSTLLDVLRLILKTRNDNPNEIAVMDIKDEIPEDIIDHCAGLQLIKFICTDDPWEGHGELWCTIIVNDYIYTYFVHTVQTERKKWLWLWLCNACSVVSARMNRSAVISATDGTNGM